ncbi:MAG: flippase [Methanosarcinales archaeon]|nr:flippase [Methanosarcinales archaeon]
MIFPRIIKNIISLASAEIITRILSLVLIIYIARILGDSGFGKYSFAFAFTSLFLLFLDPGIHSLTIRDIARKKDLAGKYMSNILIMKTFLSILAFVLIVFTINIMDYPVETRLAVYIVGIYTIMTSFSQLTRGVFRAFEKMEYEAILNILERLIFVSSGLIVLFMGYGLVEVVSVFLIAGVINILASFAITFRKFSSPVFEIDLEFWKYLIKEGLPFGLAMIFITIYIKIDTVMLSVMKGDAVVGWYSAAYQIPLAVALISAAFMESIYPTMSRLHGSSRDSLIFTYEKSFKLLAIIVFPIAVMITLFSKEIISILYGEMYVNSIFALQVLIWFTVFEFFCYLLYVTLASMDKQRINTLTTGFCAALNILLNFLLIPTYSFIGAAIATVITYILLFFLNFYFVSSYLQRISLYKIISKPIVAAAGMGIFLYFFRDLNVLIMVFFGCTLYLLSLYLLKTFSREDIEFIYRA